MSTTIGAISSVIPMPTLAKTDSAFAPAGSTSQTAVPSKREAQSDPEPFPPMPIQPLSSRMLATFMQKDIELYGSMFGA